jgi:DNA repair exonuclease SbcCD ATPase subunit
MRAEQVAPTEPVTALAVVEQLTPMQLFAPGKLDSVVDRIKAEVRAIETDISTDKGRKELKSLCYKIARSKTFIDAQRKQLVTDEKKRLAAIDAEGRRVWQDLEALYDEVRKPLTDWEDGEAQRTTECERRIANINAITAAMFIGLEQIERASADLDGWFNHGFQEFTARAVKAHDAAAAYLANEARRIRKETAEAAERERLRLAAEEKTRIEREAKIAEQARLKAEAEAKRREEAAALVAKQREEDMARAAAQEKARLEKAIEDQRVAAERERIAAQERELKAEADRVAAEKRARQEKADAEQRAQAQMDAAIRRAESDRMAAVEAERKRQQQIRAAEEQKRDAEAREKAIRETNKAHRAAVNSKALAALVSSGIDEAVAKQVISLIARGVVPNASINY